MIRTQISLDKSEYDSAKVHAEALGISVTEFIRRAVRESLRRVAGHKPWMRYCGSIDSGDPDASQSLDEVVYGSKIDS